MAKVGSLDLKTELKFFRPLQDTEELILTT
jgi:hypothetical protein